MTISKTDIVARLRGITWMGSDSLCHQAADEIERLRKERDEARRMYCSMVENNARQYGTSAQSVATQAGWDCYGEPRWNSDPNIISLDELARCTRNQTP